MNSSMIEVKNLTKTYGNKKAINNVTFSVEKGEILGFLGPNGAGKTTTMNIITGYIAATEGRVLIDGHDSVKESAACKSEIGYLPEQPPLYLNMTVYEYLKFVYGIKKVGKNPNVTEDRSEHIEKIMSLAGVSGVKDRLIRNLSKGYKQRVGIAQALIGDPPILILDEPTSGLDPKQIIEIRSVIKHLGENRTVILSSHILSEISAVCERVIIINSGTVLAEDTPENLSKRMDNKSGFAVRIEGERENIEKVLKSVYGISRFTFDGVKENGAFDYIIESDGGSDIRRPLFKELARRDMALLMFNPISMSLEDVFIKLTDNNISLIEEENAVSDVGTVTDEQIDSEENAVSGGETEADEQSESEENAVSNGENADAEDDEQ